MSHDPKVDLTSPAGAEILRLFADLKEIEESDGGWPGADAVQAICAWLESIGLDPDGTLAELQATVAELRGDGPRIIHVLDLSTAHLTEEGSDLLGASR
jgi:hypothetical protein